MIRDISDLLNKIFPFFFCLILITEGYSIIAWIAVMITDRGNMKKRKKYAYICLACIVILMVLGVASIFRQLMRN